jgi:hypothetical protein
MGVSKKIMSLAITFNLDGVWKIGVDKFNNVEVEE